RLIELATGRDLVALPGHQAPVERIAITPGRRTIVTASGGPTFLVWDGTTGQLQRQVGAVGPTTFNYFLSQDGSLAVSTDWQEPGLWVWDLRAGKKVRRLLE